MKSLTASSAAGAGAASPSSAMQTSDRCATLGAPQAAQRDAAQVDGVATIKLPDTAMSADNSRGRSIEDMARYMRIEEKENLKVGDSGNKSAKTGCERVACVVLVES